LWIQNLAMLGGWCSIDPFRPYVAGFRKNIRRVGGYFLVILDLSWETALRSDFGMMCSMEIWPLRKLSQIYITLLV